METPTRYVAFQFTCQNGHTNDCHKMVVGALTADQAIKNILGQQIKCEECGELLSNNSTIAVSANEPMSSADRTD
jgi:hypothetical protein